MNNIIKYFYRTKYYTDDLLSQKKDYAGLFEILLFSVQSYYVNFLFALIDVLISLYTYGINLI